MKKNIFLWACYFCLSNLSCQTTYPKEVEEQIKLVENSLAGRVKFEGSSGDNILERMAFYKVKGLSIAVVKDYKIVWAKGYGWADEGEKKPVTEKTMFQAASISKSINSMGVLKLVQDKKMDLYKDINDYLTSWKFPYDEVSKGQKITTLNLLTHTGGISNGAAMYLNTDTIPTAIQVLNGTKGSKFVYSDGTAVHSITAPNLQSQYSNLGIGITQIIVSDISKKPYPQYMYETIFKPLGMKSSCFSEDSAQTHKQFLTTAYSDGYEIPGKHVIIPTLSAGGMWTTPTDLCKFVIEMQLSVKGKSNKVLSQETVKRMMTAYIDSAAALGLALRRTEKEGIKYFGHGGSLKGGKCEYVGSFDGGDGVAVMINSDGSAGNIIGEVINSVATVYKWKDFYDPLIKPKPVTIAESILEKYQGIYVYENKIAIILKKPDGYYFWSDGLNNKMYFTNEKHFYNVEFQSEKTFITDEVGNVKGYTREVNGKQFPTATKIVNADTLKFNPIQIGNAAWYLLENKKYADAISFFKRRMELEPKEMMSRCNLAHSYLFNNEYDKAMKLYKDNLDKDIMPNMPFKKVVADDFVYFKQNGFDKTVMDKALADLKLETPKGYKD
ncbi:MAG TPA: serine hydrolase domain-containing protein [Bacteroidia bacterium]|jgi:CubicO group peptidase (beta-lactamase class C family)|nr:serine hydrolase domain-containing protein [Bacteroidia bacterium]